MGDRAGWAPHERLSEAGSRFDLVQDLAAAEALGFRGSPTILVDGLDPFADETLAVGMSRRLYHSEVGTEGSPSLSQLREAFRREGDARST